MIRNLQDFDSIFYLGAVSVSYPPKDINTEAIQVVPGNIGALSVELQTELCYRNDGAPFIEIEVGRGTEQNPKPDRFVSIRPGDWIVVLWDELHVFRDFEFKSTFVVSSASKHDLMMEEAKAEDAHRGNILKEIERR